MTIGWYTDAVINPPSDLFVLEPVRLSDVALQLGHYKHCPAFALYINQTFVIRSPFDLELTYENDKIKVVNSSLNQSEYGNNLTIEAGKHPVIQMELHMGLVADEPCFVEIFGPFFQAENQDSGYRVIPGTYDIYSWQRFMNFAFEWTATNRKIVIKRGQPVLFVRFRSQNLNEKFSMKRITMTDELLAAVKRCQSSKLFMKGKSWSLMPINRLLRRRNKFVK